MPPTAMAHAFACVSANAMMALKSVRSIAGAALLSTTRIANASAMSWIDMLALRKIEIITTGDISAINAQTITDALNMCWTGL